MEGYKLLSRTLELAQEVRKLINSTKVFRVLELEDLLPEAVRHDGIRLDPTKVTIDISGCGYTVDDLQKALFERFNIQVEKSTFNTLTLLLTIGTTRSKVSRLYDALMRIAREGRAPRRLVQTPEIPAVHQAALPAARRLLLRRRAGAGVRRARARQPRASPGRIAADQIVPYPPGIPVLVPGQLITKKIVDYLGGLLHSHKRMEMHGVVHEGYLPCIRVLKPEEESGLDAGSPRPSSRRRGAAAASCSAGVERAHAVAGARVQRGEHPCRAQRVALAHHRVGGAVFVQPVERLLVGEQLEQPHRLRAPAHAHAVDFARERKLVLHRQVGVLAHQDVGAVFLVQVLDARGEVHRVADHGVVEAAGRAHVADHHRPGVDADADVDRRQAALDASSRWKRAQRAASCRAPSGTRAPRAAARRSGAPNIAMIASPMYLSSEPRCSNTWPVITVKYSFISLTSSSGAIASDSVVKPRMSENSTVSSRFSPPSCSLPASATRSSTTAGGT